MSDPNPYESPQVDEPERQSVDQPESDPADEPVDAVTQPSIEVLRSLESTALGLVLAYYGLLAASVCAVGIVVALLFFRPLLFLAVPGFSLGLLAMLPAPFFCMYAPTESKAKGSAVASGMFLAVHVAFVGLVACVIFYLDPSAGHGPDVMGSAIMWLFALLFTVQFAGLAGVIALVLFVDFLRRIGRYIGRDDLVARSRNLLIIAPIAFVLCWLSIQIAYAIVTSNLSSTAVRAIATVWGGLVVIGVVLVVFKLLGLILSFAKTLTRLE